MLSFCRVAPCMLLRSPFAGAGAFLQGGTLRGLRGGGCACGRTKGLSARPLETFGVAILHGGGARGVALGYRKVVRRYCAKSTHVVCTGSARSSGVPQSCPPSVNPSRAPACWFLGDRGNDCQLGFVLLGLPLWAIKRKQANRRWTKLKHVSNRKNLKQSHANEELANPANE